MILKVDDFDIEICHLSSAGAYFTGKNLLTDREIKFSTTASLSRNLNIVKKSPN